MAANGVSEHFSDERRERNAPRTRSGRSSPSHSAHGALIRSSLRKLSAEKKAKKIHFFRNGDRFFKGVAYAVSSERFRTYESLLEDLTRTMVDKVSLPNGVRYIFTLDGAKISSLDQFQEGENYVCASSEVYRKINYHKIEVPQWNIGNIRHEQDISILKFDFLNSEGPKDFIRPKLITIIRNGIKPRKAVRMLLNKKTAHSFEQVLNDITEAIKLDTGAVRKIFSIDGKPISSLSDFFKDDDIFIAYGPEKFAHDDFDLDSDECKYLSQSKTIQKIRSHSVRSPIPHHQSSSPNGSDQGNGRISQPGSPRTPRKLKGKPLSKMKIQNGHGDSIVFPVSLTDKYEIGKIIGDGNFAVVRECLHKSSNKEYALKIINKSKCKGKEQMIESEVSILRKIKHGNIVSLLEEFDTPNELYLIMELVKGGDLFDAISTSTKYTERDASGMVYNLASALRYLHSLSIVHRDIKPENLLVCEHADGSKSLKLGDFGLAVEVKEPLTTVCGTPTYVAPEILAETGYGLKVDIWAAGVITYILLCGFPPFVSQYNNQDELFDQILCGRYEFTSPYWDDISDYAKELITHMLQVDPKRRFSAAQVLDHAWVSDDLALDHDMQLNVSHKLSMHFDTKPKLSLKAAGVALIASTALDKEDKYYFQTSRRTQDSHSLPDSLSPSGHSFSSQQDEIF